VKDETQDQRQVVSDERSGRMSALADSWQRTNGNWAENHTGFGYEDLHRRITGEATLAQQEARQSEGKK
jgi:hypothetical protein